MKLRDYYTVLGVNRGASQRILTRAYRKLARKFHPDISHLPDAESRFKAITEAYNVLISTKKRDAYDHFLAQRASDADIELPSDASLGLQSQQASLRSRHQNTIVKLFIDIEDAYGDSSCNVTLEDAEFGADRFPVLRERTLDVQIPRGIQAGQHIRLCGQGDQSDGAASPGDLFLQVFFRDHPIFFADGADVYLELPVAPWEAVLGASVQVPTPTGAIDLRLPAGSGSGCQVRVRGRGIPSAKPGDLIVVPRIVLPEADSDDRRQAYRAFKNAFRFDPREHLQENVG